MFVETNYKIRYAALLKILKENGFTLCFKREQNQKDKILT